MSSVGTIDINLKANTQTYDSRINKSRRNTRRFGEQAQSTSSIFSSSFVKIGLVVGATSLVLNKAIRLVKGFGEEFAKVGDEIGKGAARTQLSTDDFQTLSFAMEQSGGDSKKLETAVRGLNMAYRRLSDGAPTAIKTFNELGLTLKDLEGLNPAEQFRKTALALKNIEDPARRAAIANELFSRAGTDVISLSSNLLQYEQRLRDVGGVLDEEGIRKGEQLTDINNELSRVYRSLSFEFSDSFFPAIVLVVEAMKDLIFYTKTYIGLGPALSNLIAEIPLVGTTILGAIKGMNAAGEFAGGQTAGRQAPLSKDATSRTRPDTSAIDKQIEAQRELIQALRDQSTKLSPLPQALQKGTQAQIGFMAQLDRQNQQSKIDAREQKKISIAEKHLKELEDIRKAITEQDNEIEVAIL